jgi:ATP-dependent RNA helicase DDX1
MSGGFSALGLLPELLHAIDDLGWQLPTDIQDEAIPQILGGGDVMGAAETGSGKTAAFALPLIQSVFERLKKIEESSGSASAAASLTGKASPQSGSGKKRKVDSIVSTPPGSHEKQSSSSTSVSLSAISLNPNDRDQDLVVTANELGCSYQTKGNEWMGIRATHGVRRGKVYFEMKVLGKGNCRVGWSTVSGHLELGKDSHGFGYGGKGWKSFQGQYERYGGEYTENDIIGVYLNLIDHTLYFAKNGVMLDKCYDIPEVLQGSVFFPTITLSNSAAEVNFGTSTAIAAATTNGTSSTHHGLKYRPQDGYVPLGLLPADQLFTTDSMECYVASSSQQSRLPMALIIEPTRDLAEQVYQSILDLSKYIDQPKLRTLLMIGDDAKTNTKAKLQQGVDIIVGTIGKLTGAMQQNQLDLSQIRFLVLDEADKLTSPDNIASIKQIFSKCPGGGTGYHRLQVSKSIIQSIFSTLSLSNKICLFL